MVDTGAVSERSGTVEFQWSRLDFHLKNQMDGSAAESQNITLAKNRDRCKSELLEHFDCCRNYCCIDRPQIDHVQCAHY